MRVTIINNSNADDRDNMFPGSFSPPAFLNGDRYTPPTRGTVLQIGLGLLSGTFSNANLEMTLGGLNPDVRQTVGENPKESSGRFRTINLSEQRDPSISL
jgi:hypothetical protein